MNIFEQHLALKEKIRAGQPTLGLFIRTPAPQIIESLAETGLDFVALDAEHAPFGINALDTCILAARASGISVLVRVPEANSTLVLSVLDMGGGIVSSEEGDGRHGRSGLGRLGQQHETAGAGAIVVDILNNSREYPGPRALDVARHGAAPGLNPALNPTVR